MHHKKKSFFIKAFGCFLLIILILTTVIVALKINEGRNIKEATVKNLNIEFLNESENLQQLFLRMNSTLGEISARITEDEGFTDNSYPGKNSVRDAMKSILVDVHQNEFSKFLSAIFVVDERNPGEIYEYFETYSNEEFFLKFSGRTYDGNYWHKCFENEKNFEVLQADEFSVFSETMKRVNIDLMPVVYKPKINSNFAVIALLDANEITETFGVSAIYSEKGVPLYVADTNIEEKLDEVAANDTIQKVTNFGNDFVFASSGTGDERFRIVKYISGETLGKDIGFSLNSGFWIIIGGVLVSIGIAFAMSLRFSKEMRALRDDVAEAIGEESESEKVGYSVRALRDTVKQFGLQHMKAAQEKDNNDSVLDSLFLQSKVRDVYVGIDDIEKKVDISRSFFMVYLRVNYKEEFENYIGEDTGKATFLLKQLIEMHLESCGLTATTFQIEKNGIVSVFDVSEGSAGEKEIAEGLVEKLDNESEYAFFTVSVSHIYDGMEKITSVYDALIDLSRYSKPIEETQLLFEGDAQLSAGRFYFSVEEMGKLSAILQNGNEEEVDRKIDEILDYNIKKEINCFGLYLLSTEIVNCAVKLVNRKLHTVPQNIKLSDVYKELDHAHTPNEYRVVCNEFLHEVMSVVRENKREDDYIISYILEYIDNHYAEDIYLNLFAEKLKLTAAYISSYFKEKMNVNLSDYLNNYRIKKAVELSENPQNKNKDIAVMVGLPNINTFIRLFKKYTGYTPGEYRKKHYGDDYKK